MSEQSTALP